MNDRLNFSSNTLYDKAINIQDKRLSDSNSFTIVKR